MSCQYLTPTLSNAPKGRSVSRPKLLRDDNIENADQHTEKWRGWGGAKGSCGGWAAGAAQIQPGQALSEHLQETGAAQGEQIL